MTTDLSTQLCAYAELIVRSGVNLQPGQALTVVAELAHREFARLLAVTAYEAGARLVEIDWLDPLTSRIRFKHSNAGNLDFVPEYEVPRAHEMLETGWARVRLTGSEYPDAFEDVDPAFEPREGDLGQTIAVQITDHLLAYRTTRNREPIHLNEVVVAVVLEDNDRAAPPRIHGMDDLHAPIEIRVADGRIANVV